MALDKYTQLHLDYIDTMSKFYDIYPKYSQELSRKFDRAISVAALHLWRDTDATATQCARAIEELHYEKKLQSDNLSAEKIRPYYEKVKAENRPAGIPIAFYNEVLEYDKHHDTAYFLVLGGCYVDVLKSLSYFLIDGDATEDNKRAAFFRLSNSLTEINRCYRKMKKDWDACNLFGTKEETATVSYDTGLDELNSLIGLEKVKKEISQLEKLVKVQQMRREQGLPVPSMSQHLVFTGNPGTGKTTVARILARIYGELGLLSGGHMVEVDRSGLVSGYIGQSAIKTLQVIENAMGGVLFIDEAYALYNENEEDFGHEVIDTILKAMEDYRDDFIVIAAGYEEEMKAFISSNPGLASRFKKTIFFEDYSPDELYRIFMRQCKRHKYVMYDEAKAEVMEYFIQVCRHRGENFGNGRVARKYFEQAVTRQAERIADNPDASLNVLTLEDVRWERAQEGISLEAAMAKLNGLIGLQSTKDQLQELFNFVRVQQMKKEKGMATEPLSLHMVFTGNPGTGKTTVAREISKIYRAMGLLSKGHFVEVDRGNLVAGYIGQSAIKTRQVIESAMGGVLFIDEAYALYNESEQDFGHEVIDTILKAMEDHRDNLVVIMAGYPDEMEKMIRSNPGLKSRFNRFIHFPDYSTEELMKIFMTMCKTYRVTDGAKQKLTELFEQINAPDFGNGRGVRNIYEKTIARQAGRVLSKGGDIDLITEEDIPERADILKM